MPVSITKLATPPTWTVLRISGPEGGVGNWPESRVQTVKRCNLTVIFSVSGNSSSSSGSGSGSSSSSHSGSCHVSVNFLDCCS